MDESGKFVIGTAFVLVGITASESVGHHAVTPHAHAEPEPFVYVGSPLQYVVSGQLSQAIGVFDLNNRETCRFLNVLPVEPL